MAKSKTQSLNDKCAVLQELAEELLKNLLVNAEIEVTEDPDNEALKIRLKSENETGLLIGKRGENLFSLQYILGLCFKQKTGDWVRIIIDVGDYREKQEEYLKDLAKQAAVRVLETGEPQTLYNLTPSQRRIIHMALSEEKGISTESLGEDRDRYLVVKKK